MVEYITFKEHNDRFRGDENLPYIRYLVDFPASPLPELLNRGNEIEVDNEWETHPTICAVVTRAAARI